MPLSNPSLMEIPNVPRNVVEQGTHESITHKRKEIPLPFHPVLWERKIVVVSAVVVSSKKQIPHVEEKDCEAVTTLHYHWTT